ncbi:AraC family transcriptional regulator [Hymenobacter weizhouensis]|uniref:AraC family transcriptional regulator n=1 Tax=Hymenobacter sp. YIM 151500-1 TaxID=2987689 RepID=UPI002225FB37|nr:AraC family transcriptional regulator [Hymenobacter sp. YIM 151500-1]UYZ62634.1 AraC family transcriptional regulator [Hymenobacter sp. YIM 151500-1]
MKLQFEPIHPTVDSSFTLLHYTEVQQGGLLWHYHPEYELVYIPRGHGRRHIGQHISRFEDGELVLIGPDLPHLTFSYGQPAGAPFEEIVVQLRGDFLGPDFWQRPELSAIRQLLSRSHEGLSFGGATRAAVGTALRQLLDAPPFARLLLLLQVLQELAQAAPHDCTPLHAGTGGLGLSGKEQQRLSRVYQFVEQHYHRASLSVQEVADVAYLSVPAFCRYFKKMTRHTLTDFLQEYRVGQACRLLLDDDLSVTEVSYASGFNNLSHFNKTFRKYTGQSPTEYRRQRLEQV